MLANLWFDIQHTHGVGRNIVGGQVMPTHVYASDVRQARPGNVAHLGLYGTSHSHDWVTPTSESMGTIATTLPPSMK